ncbi:hypothetical protein [Phyllobacterium bourgognense]|uniref:Uncharacterized protein n=1 Tax=Phyllobacterium bourgognense TaxID=314236 RepID=A0A368YN15_9HYPH|nr:hypothetical protein [Phyllobacterium bourgognense]RCW80928.1 hypothetical protein C7476_11284 [Phyllobacterium bourgognense]
MRGIWILAITSIFSCDANAQTSAEYALMAKRSVAAFMCVSLAAGLEDKHQEYNRLFGIAYNEGKRFLEAAMQGKVSQHDMGTEVPMIFSLSGDSPNIDFMLGRIAAKADDEVFKKVYLDDQRRTFPADIVRNNFEDQYRQHNCDLL